MTVPLDSDQLLQYGLLAAGFLFLWFFFRVLKKVILVVLIVVAVVGIGLGLFLKFL